MAKIHYIDSAEPISGTRRLKANCGKEIINPEFAFTVDFDRGEARPFNSLTDCRNCNTTRPVKRYLYGVMEGQEMRTGDAA